jgi:hypothetical protein
LLYYGGYDKEVNANHLFFNVINYFARIWGDVLKWLEISSILLANSSYEHALQLCSAHVFREEINLNLPSFDLVSMLLDHLKRL